MTIKELKERYSTLEKIKKGGQKTVYKAVRSCDGIVVALKIISDASDVRVLQEIEIVRKLDLENVPKILESGIVFDEGISEDVLFIEEQYVEGESLRDWLNRKNTFDLSMAIQALDFLLSIEVVLERAKILHRDINPNNILISAEQKLYLIDFGLARDLSAASITLTGAQYGPCTPGYAPNEQIMNQKCNQDVRTDLYQIGVTVYEGCTGRNPFIMENDTVLDVLARTVSAIPTRLTISGDKNGLLSQFINMLMAKNQSQRPESAEQAVRYLEAIKKTLDWEV